MPAITTTIDRDQRDGLYELVRNHLGSIEDFWIALERIKDFAKAEELSLEFAEDFRLLQDIGWSEHDERETFGLTMPAHDLMELLKRLHDEAVKILLGTGSSEAQSRREDADTDRRFQLGYETCEKVLAEFDSPGRVSVPASETDCGQELDPYTEVKDSLILAAVERAVLHEREDEVLTSVLTQHLGFVSEPETNRLLFPRLEGLRRAGLLTTIERRSEPFWALTDVGRERLASDREAGEVDDLPESPQHRAWRHARVKAAVRIGGFRSDLLHAVGDAYSLINKYRSPMSEEWFELSERLRLASWRLASATYCLTEWVEPEDECPDLDEHPGPRPGRRAIWAWDRDIPTGEEP